MLGCLPVVNYRPCNLKSSFAGINKGHVEAMESRLKQDVLKEAQEYSNQIMVAHEDDDFQIVQKWEAVTEVDVQTPLEVYRELEGKKSWPKTPLQAASICAPLHSTHAF